MEHSGNELVPIFPDTTLDELHGEVVRILAAHALSGNPCVVASKVCVPQRFVMPLAEKLVDQVPVGWGGATRKAVTSVKFSEHAVIFWEPRSRIYTVDKTGRGESARAF